MNVCKRNHHIVPLQASQLHTETPHINLSRALDNESPNSSKRAASPANRPVRARMRAPQQQMAQQLDVQNSRMHVHTTGDGMRLYGYVSRSIHPGRANRQRANKSLTSIRVLHLVLSSRLHALATIHTPSLLPPHPPKSHLC